MAQIDVRQDRTIGRTTNTQATAADARAMESFYAKHIGISGSGHLRRINNDIVSGHGSNTTSSLLSVGGFAAQMVGELEAENRLFRAQLDELNRRNDELNREIGELNRKYEDEQARVGRRDDTIGRRDDKIKSLKDDKEELNDRIDAKDGELNHLRADKQRLRRKINRKNDEIDDLNVQLVNLRRELDEAKHECDIAYNYDNGAPDWGDWFDQAEETHRRQLNRYKDVIKQMAEYIRNFDPQFNQPSLEHGHTTSDTEAGEYATELLKQEKLARRRLARMVFNGNNVNGDNVIIDAPIGNLKQEFDDTIVGASDETNESNKENDAPNDDTKTFEEKNKLID